MTKVDLTEAQRLRRRYSGQAYDWRDHPDSGKCPDCYHCDNRARWAIAQPQEWPNDGKSHPGDFDWRIKVFACGRHLHGILADYPWSLDVVQIYDLAQIPEGGC